MKYHSKCWSVTVGDAHISTPIATCVPSVNRLGKWFCAFMVQGFNTHIAYAVTDDFGSLVEVAQ